MTFKLHTEFTVLGEIVLDNEKKRLKFNSPDYYLSRMEKLPVGKKIHVTISTEVPTRSQTQLAYFMVLAGYIADYNGNTTAEMYPILIEDCFEPKFIIWKGEERKVRESISDVAKFPKWKMQELIDHTLGICADLEIHVPTREELGYLPS